MGAGGGPHCIDPTIARRGWWNTNLQDDYNLTRGVWGCFSHLGSLDGLGEVGGRAMGGFCPRVGRWKHIFNFLNPSIDKKKYKTPEILQKTNLWGVDSMAEYDPQH